MKKIIPALCLIFCCVLITLLVTCKRKNATPAIELIKAINLKRGQVVLCGPPDKQLGTVSFETSCSGDAKKDFDLGIALLHSFEYDEAEKVFAKIIDSTPGCAMAYWGVAMCNYHQVWPSPPSPAELDKGNKAISIAQSIQQKSIREADYINAIALFYKDWKTIDHRSRVLKFEGAMENCTSNIQRIKKQPYFMP